MYNNETSTLINIVQNTCFIIITELMTQLHRDINKS